MKDLKKTSQWLIQNLDDVIIVDDIRDFVPEAQKQNMFWIDDRFPYRDRIYGKLPVPDGETRYRERNKFQWISHYLLEALKRRKSGSKSFSMIIQEMTDNGRKTPFTPGKRLTSRKGKRSFISRFHRLNESLSKLWIISDPNRIVS